MRQAQGPLVDLALHTLGWKAFQDLCAQTCEEVLRIPVETYREAQDGGQDAVFVTKNPKGSRIRNATVQCKFSAKYDKKFTKSDLTSELDTVADLVAKGLADTYVLMTSMGIDAPIAAEIKETLRRLGVNKPHVFGKEYLTRVIRASPRLRALVPRVYGLGDLSQILDERQALQTTALLGHMIPTLKVYVPTKPHILAVQKLKKFGIVLLLGDPATGKSTIAAMLATTASENLSHFCYRIDRPDELARHWNPHESKSFYWIDDAFGANQLREDFVDQWISMMPKIQAAIMAGNKFVITSRRHVYLAAKPKLGSRNHPLLSDGQAVIEVGSLSASEREQILYNHIKMGKQPPYWKRIIKTFLPAVIAEPSFLPEIARRLGDPQYTKNMQFNAQNVVDFVRRPKEYLTQTIEELSDTHMAGLVMIFLHKNQMPVGNPSSFIQSKISEYFSVDPNAVSKALRELMDSFIVISGDDQYWSFKHPTIIDAISSILAKKDGMAELYLRGSRIENILEETICSGIDKIRDAVVIPANLHGLLIDIIAQTPDDPKLNLALFIFLARRVSPQFLREFLTLHPAILGRRTAFSYNQIRYDPRFIVLARAHSFGLLPKGIRKQVAAELENAIEEGHDVSFFLEDQILEIMSATQLLKCQKSIINNVVKETPNRVEETLRDIDLDAEPSQAFQHIESSLDEISWIFEGIEEYADILDEAYESIQAGIKTAKQRKADSENEKSREDDWEWIKKEPAQVQVTSRKLFSGSRGPRSIFSDIDE